MDLLTGLTLMEVLSKPQNCEACGLYRGCKSYKIDRETSPNYVPGTSVDLLIIGESPKATDDQQGGLFMGDDGRFLRGFLEAWDGTWALTTLVKCRPPQGRSPEEYEINACEPFLTNDVSELEPKVIVLLGSTVLKSFWKEGPKTITRARVAPVKLGSTWVLTTYAPGMHTSGKQNLTTEYVRTFEMAGKLLDGSIRDDNPDVREVTSQDDVNTLCQQMAASPEIIIDGEWSTNAERPTIYFDGVKPICWGIGTNVEEPIWVVPARFMTPDIVKLMYGKTIGGHFVKGDIQALVLWYDPQLWFRLANVEDSGIMHSSVNQGFAENSLVEMSSKYLGTSDWKSSVWRLVDQENERRGKLDITDEATLADIPFPPVRDMNGRDVWNSMRLIKYQREQNPPRLVYETLLKPATIMLGVTEQNGLGVDRQMEGALVKCFTEKAAEIQERLIEKDEVQRVLVKLPLARADRKQAKEIEKYEADSSYRMKPVRIEPIEWNCQSPDQLEYLLVETDLTVVKKAKKATIWMDGQEVAKSSIDKNILPFLALDNAVWMLVKYQRDLQYALDKWLIPFPKHISHDGRIHCRFNVAKVERGGIGYSSDAQSGGTDSGRLAALDPALHNIKAREAVDLGYEVGRLIRLMFAPTTPGQILYENDYAQTEPRYMAVLSGSQPLMDACNEGDLYKGMAAFLYKKKIADVLKGERAMLKVGVLAAVLYLESEDGFAARTRIPLHEVHDFFVMAQGRFPEVVEFQKTTIAAARAGKELITMWGRSCTFDHMYTGRWGHDHHVDIKAVNFLVQSPAADTTLWKAIKVFEKWGNKIVRLVNLIHDAHVAETAKNIVYDVIREHKKLMEDRSDLPFDMPVPIPVDTKIGERWGSMYPWEVTA